MIAHPANWRWCRAYLGTGKSQCVSPGWCENRRHYFALLLLQYRAVLKGRELTRVWFTALLSINTDLLYMLQYMTLYCEAKMLFLIANWIITEKCQENDCTYFNAITIELTGMSTWMIPIYYNSINWPFFVKTEKRKVFFLMCAYLTSITYLYIAILHLCTK